MLDYLNAVKRTGSSMTKDVADLGLIGETGEVAELIKKHLGHRQPLDLEKLNNEIGDVAFYVIGRCIVVHWDDAQLVQWLTEAKESVKELHGSPFGLTHCVKFLHDDISRIIKNGPGPASCDALVSLAALAFRAGTTLQAALDANVAKLRKRWPNGFDPRPPAVTAP